MRSDSWFEEIRAEDTGEVGEAGDVGGLLVGEGGGLM
jgi:hypothetical protein